MPALKALVFDLGNVFIFHDNALLFRTLAARAGKPTQAIASAFDLKLWERINKGELAEEALQAHVCGLMGVELPADEFDTLWNCHFSLNPELFPMVEALVGKVKLLLLSNTNAIHTRFLLPQVPVLKKFDHLLLSSELGVAKPDPAIFREALRLAGTRPEETAFFDDIPEYVAAASALGIHGRLFAQTRDFPEQLRQLGL